MIEETVANLFLQYGLAGIVIFMFYKIMSSDIENLRNSIMQLKESIDKLIFEIKNK